MKDLQRFSSASTFRLLCLLGLVFTASRGSTLPQSGGQVPEPLRVLVYNIHAGKDLEGKGNLGRIADIIVASQADLVLLQEVDRNTERSGAVDQVAVLAQLTGYHGAFDGISRRVRENSVLPGWGIRHSGSLALACDCRHPLFPPGRTAAAARSRLLRAARSPPCSNRGPERRHSVTEHPP
jgi:hypothetical protein